MNNRLMKERQLVTNSLLASVIIMILLESATSLCIHSGSLAAYSCFFVDELPSSLQSRRPVSDAGWIKPSCSLLHSLGGQSLMLVALSSSISANPWSWLNKACCGLTALCFDVSKTKVKWLQPCLSSFVSRLGSMTNPIMNSYLPWEVAWAAQQDLLQSLCLTVLV